jgi:glutathione S-transferase
MKLFFSPGFSSLADHIAMLEAGLQFELEVVDFETKRMAGGGNYVEVNPKGYIPALRFDDGQLLTENVAILAWVADQAPQLAPAGPLARYRLLEMLSFIACEIHKRFPIYLSASDPSKTALREDILRWFGLLAGRLKNGYLFGETFTVADAYLFVMARGAAALEFPLPPQLSDYVARIEARPITQEALRREAQHTQA